MRLVIPVLVLALFATACGEDEQKDKRPVIQVTAIGDTASTAAIGGEVLTAAQLVGARESIKIVSDSVCKSEDCAVKGALDVGAGFALVVTMDRLEGNERATLKLVDAKTGALRQVQRVLAPDATALAAKIPFESEALLAKAFGFKLQAVAPSTSTPPVAATEPLKRKSAAKTLPKRKAKAKPRAAKSEEPASSKIPGLVIYTGDALRALDGNTRVGDPGTLTIFSDKITWRPGALAIGARVLTLKMEDIKGVSFRGTEGVWIRTGWMKVFFDVDNEQSNVARHLNKAVKDWTGRDIGN